MALLLPAAFFAALDRGAEAGLEVSTNGVVALISDASRDKFLRMSRGLAILLLLV
jgi:Ca2+:H+ antiporter